MSIQGLIVHAVSMPAEFAEDARVIWFVTAMRELIAWHRGAVLTGWSCKNKGDHWLLVVHTQKHKKGGDSIQEVCFVRADGMFGSFTRLAYGLRNDSLSWKPDQFPIT